MAQGEAEVDQACFDLAITTMVERGGADRQQVRAHADQLAVIAKSYISDELGINLLLIARAVRYLDQVHAIPPMGNDTRWFTDMLTAVLELARPNSGAVEGDALKFLQDVQEGIRALTARSTQ